jgi:hypothetical protein
MSSNEPVATAPKRQAGPFTFLPRSHSEAPVPMAVHQKRALRAAGVFFGTWLLLALASADFLPPPGFVIVLLILFACMYPCICAGRRRAPGGEHSRWRVAR